MICNYLQEENYPAAKVAVSWLFVCLDQSAMDAGKMDLGLLLALVEIHRSESKAVCTNGQPEVGHLKEMDAITTRRQEVAGRQQTQPAAASGPINPSPKAKPNRQFQRHWKGLEW